MKKGTVNGYKVCYKEEGAKDYIRHYMTYTHKQAKKMLMYYKRYPQVSRKDNHPLVKPKWVIIPIKKSEIRDGIWREIPFLKKKGFFYFYRKHK